MIVNADTSDPALQPETGGVRRRPDYVLIAAALGAEVLDHRDVLASRVGRLLRRYGGGQGTYVALGLLAFLRRRRVDAYWADSENEGIVLAALLKLARRRVPLVMTGIYPAKRDKWAAWRVLRVQTHIDTVLPIVLAEVDRLLELGVPGERIEPVPYGVDPAFFDPALATPLRRERPYVLAAGLQHRDYPTLLRACEGLDVDLLIAAGSHWATTGSGLDPATLPPWVTVTSLGYVELRDAYAGAAVVAAPTVEAPFAPGMTSLLEAMSMARPVIATRSAGNDYVLDRRATLRADPSRSTAGGFGMRLAAPGTVGQTGWYFAPGDDAELGRVLSHVLSDPSLAAEVGARARQVVREVYSVDSYAAAVVAAVHAALARRGDTPE